MKQIFQFSRFRILVILIAPFIFFGSSVRKPAPKPQWEQLFNGKDIKGWNVKIRTHDLNDNYGNTFRVKDGNIQVRYDQYTEFNQQYGHLFLNKPYSYYLIGVEYRFVGEHVKGGEGWA